MDIDPRSLRAHTRLSSFAVLSRESPERIACIVEDLSRMGARVTFFDSPVVPKRFDLLVGSSPTPHRVRVVWQRAGAVGVQFLEPRANAPEVMPG